MDESSQATDKLTRAASLPSPLSSFTLLLLYPNDPGLLAVKLALGISQHQDPPTNLTFASGSSLHGVIATIKAERGGDYKRKGNGKW